MAPKKQTARPVPTELESCVLAIVERLGACSPYAVRSFLSASESSYWSASAGAIYPLLQRLSEAGWISFQERPFGSRRRRSYRLTRKGRRELDKWLSAPVQAAVVAHTYDPIRARVFFLDMVSPETRCAFLDDAILKTAETLARHEEDRREKRADLSKWELHGREGAIRELSARLEWLRETRAAESD